MSVTQKTDKSRYAQNAGIHEDTHLYGITLTIWSNRQPVLVGGMYIQRASVKLTCWGYEELIGFHIILGKRVVLKHETDGQWA